MNSPATFRPKLVACDLDGTLLRSDFTFSAYTGLVLRRLADIGVPFVIATGRALGTWLPMLDRLAVSAPVVCANGALVTDPDGSRVLAEWPISRRDIAAEVAILRDRYADVMFGVERGADLLHEAGYRPTVWAPHRSTRCVDTLELHATPAHLLRIQTTSTDARTLALSDGCGLVMTDSGASTAEAVAGGVSKASAVAWLAAHHGIDATDVLAFGDHSNDVSLLRWAGRGVAVANASADAMGVADDTTGSCDDDGVAIYLDRTFGWNAGGKHEGDRGVRHDRAAGGASGPVGSRRRRGHD